MKKEFKFFTIFKYEEEQEYLRDMHKHGWKLVKISGIGTYHFAECEPEDVVYQLDYNLEKNNEYFQMFKIVDGNIFSTLHNTVISVNQRARCKAKKRFSVMSNLVMI